MLKFNTTFTSVLLTHKKYNIFMKFKKLGTTDLNVSLICLGTMTWGTQNSEKDAFEQMDYSLGQGVNFFDTGEKYSVLPTSES